MELQKRRSRIDRGSYCFSRSVAYLNRRTSCGQRHATATFAAHKRAASSSATSTTAKPPSCSLVSAYGPSMISGVPLDGPTLNTGASSSSPPVNMRTPAGFMSALNALTRSDAWVRPSSVRSGTHSWLNAMRYSAMSPPLASLVPEASTLINERPPSDSTPRVALLRGMPYRSSGVIVPGYFAFGGFVDGSTIDSGAEAVGQRRPREAVSGGDTTQYPRGASTEDRQTDRRYVRRRKSPGGTTTPAVNRGADPSGDRRRATRPQRSRRPRRVRPHVARGVRPRGAADRERAWWPGDSDRARGVDVGVRSRSEADRRHPDGRGRLCQRGYVRARDEDCGLRAPHPRAGLVRASDVQGSRRGRPRPCVHGGMSGDRSLAAVP